MGKQLLCTLVHNFRISKEDHEKHVAALNKEEKELEEALAHSLDEHKRLAVAKQNQEILLAEHFAKVNITDPAGKALKKPVLVY